MYSSYIDDPSFTIANRFVVMFRSGRYDKSGVTTLSVTPESALRFSNGSPLSSLNSFRSRIPASSLGVEAPNSQESLSTSAGRTLKRYSAQMAAVSNLRQEFDELTSGLGAHVDDDLLKRIAMAGLNKAFDGQNIPRWQLDMQSRPMPLNILEIRRHTAPAAYPVQSSSESSLPGHH